MAPSEKCTYKYVAEFTRVSSATNDINDKRYFEDYYIEKKLKVKVRQTDNGKH